MPVAGKGRTHQHGSEAFRKGRVSSRGLGAAPIEGALPGVAFTEWVRRGPIFWAPNSVTSGWTVSHFSNLPGPNYFFNPWMLCRPEPLKFKTRLYLVTGGAIYYNKCIPYQHRQARGRGKRRSSTRLPEFELTIKYVGEATPVAIPILIFAGIEALSVPWIFSELCTISRAANAARSAQPLRCSVSSKYAMKCLSTREPLSPECR